MEEILVDSLLNKKLITEKRVGDTYKYTLTEGGSKEVKLLLKNELWVRVAKLIQLGYSDMAINMFINKYSEGGTKK